MCFRCKSTSKEKYIEKDDIFSVGCFRDEEEIPIEEIFEIFEDD